MMGCKRLTSRLNRVPKTVVRAFLIMRFLVQIQPVGGDVVPHRLRDPVPNRLAGAHPAPDLGRRNLYLKAWNLPCLMPRWQLGCGIRPDEKYERRRGLPSAEGSERLDRVGRTRPVDLDPFHLKSRFVCDGKLHHPNPIGGIRTVAAHLEGLLAHRHEPELREGERLRRRLGDEKMTKVDGIEGPTEQTNHQESAGSTEHALAVWAALGWNRRR